MLVKYYILISLVSFCLLSGWLLNRKLSQPAAENRQVYFWAGNCVYWFLYAFLVALIFVLSLMNSTIAQMLEQLAGKAQEVITPLFNLAPTSIASELNANSLFIVPVLAWFVILFVPLGRSSVGRQSLDYLGPIDLRLNQSWMLPSLVSMLSVILIIPLMIGALRSYYPEALYASALIMWVNIVFLAFSKQMIDGNLSETIEQKSELDLPIFGDWVEALNVNGVPLSPIGMIESERKSSRENDSIADIVKKNEESGESSIFLAANHSGQIEYIENLALELLETSFEVVLLVAPKEGIELLQLQLDESELLKGRTNIVSGPDYELTVGKYIHLVDPATLSDSLLPRLLPSQNLGRRAQGITRIGAVVWWDLHYYAGVLATQVWAINHRLNRLIETHGNSHTKKIGFCMGTGDAFKRGGLYDYHKYIESLMPSDTHQNRIDVPGKIGRNLDLYQLKSFQLLSSPNTNINDGFQHILFRSAYASILSGRKTYAFGWEKILTRYDCKQFSEFKLRDENFVHDWMVTDIDCAEASIIYLDASNVLAFREIILNAGGRLDTHSVAVLTDGNPLVEYFLGQYLMNGFMPINKRLIAPKPKPETFKRQLRLVLSESKILMSEIVADYRGQRSQINKIIEDARETLRGINKSEIRYLDNEGNLQIENTYSSSDRIQVVSNKPISALKSDDSNLTQLECPDRANSKLFLVDTERLWTKYYPGALFKYDGEYFQVDTDANYWKQAVASHDPIRCETIRTEQQSFRDYDTEFLVSGAVEQSSVHNLKHTSTLKFSRCSGEYKETLKLVAHRALPGCYEDPQNSDQFYEENPFGFINYRTNSRAICLQFSNSEAAIESDFLLTLAYIFELALPIFFSLKNTDFEVVVSKPDKTIYLVESYSDNIGFIDSITVSDIESVIAWVLQWLSDCECEGGCHQCLFPEGSSFFHRVKDLNISKSAFMRLFK